MCGGTLSAGAKRDCILGLSPRVRGNLVARRARLDYRRSIPACAGEPHAAAGDRGHGRVYPRVCGGTRRLSRARIEASGLSPRVRGTGY